MAATDQILEFTLGTERYCIDIDYVTEIVDVEQLTEVPNAPPYVEGVMDLRGETTAIVDPKTIFGLDGDGDGERVIVLDPGVVTEREAAGWLVDGVRRVVGIDDESVDPAPGSGEAVRGVIKRDGGFVVWVNPRVVHAG
ncbi:chemotaxis protein CheW [Halobacteriales archaeon QS_1_68_17]|nr:MAG: chemotaxis protein CheW [Halobacteriales archaeon QS_1_68_17]